MCCMPVNVRSFVNNKMKITYRSIVNTCPVYIPIHFALNSRRGRRSNTRFCIGYYIEAMITLFQVINIGCEYSTDRFAAAYPFKLCFVFPEYLTILNILIFNSKGNFNPLIARINYQLSYTFRWGRCDRLF